MFYNSKNLPFDKPIIEKREDYLDFWKEFPDIIECNWNYLPGW